MDSGPEREVLPQHPSSHNIGTSSLLCPSVCFITTFSSYHCLFRSFNLHDLITFHSPRLTPLYHRATDTRRIHLDFHFQGRSFGCQERCKFMELLPSTLHTRSHCKLGYTCGTQHITETIEGLNPLSPSVTIWSQPHYYIKVDPIFLYV